MTGRESIGIQGLIEDVLGLNIRGLRTIRDSFTRPGTVAEAARSMDWLNTYTPSIRVCFFVLTLLSVLRFIWAPDDGALVEFIAAQIAESETGSALTAEERQARINTYFALYGAAFPFTHLIGQALAACVLPIWGRGTSFVLRLRLHYAALIPGLSVGVIAITPFAFANDASEMFALQLGSMILALMIDGATSFRMLPQEPKTARLWRAAVFAITASLFGVGASAATSMVTSIIAL